MAWGVIDACYLPDSTCRMGGGADLSYLRYRADCLQLHAIASCLPNVAENCNACTLSLGCASETRPHLVSRWRDTTCLVHTCLHFSYKSLEETGCGCVLRCTGKVFSNVYGSRRNIKQTPHCHVFCAQTLLVQYCTVHPKQAIWIAVSYGAVTYIKQNVYMEP